MEVFHVVIDASLLRKMHFAPPDFARLLLQSRKGLVRIYIPHIVLEEHRTQMVAQMLAELNGMRDSLQKLTKNLFGMLADGLPTPTLDIWTGEELIRNSRDVYGRFLRDNKIEVVAISLDQAANAWEWYFDCAPPFDPAQSRENRRKDIPDSWILEAALEIKAKPGRHCALVDDRKLTGALSGSGFETYQDVNALIQEVEKTSTVAPLSAPPAPAALPLDQLRGPAFEGIDLIILGLNEALKSPSKDDLFATLERGGINRAIAEHEAKTLVLAGVLQDTGHHLIPANVALAQQASNASAVQELLMRIV